MFEIAGGVILGGIGLVIIGFIFSMLIETETGTLLTIFAIPAGIILATIMFITR